MTTAARDDRFDRGASGAAPAERPCALVAEDQATVRGVIARVLRRSGFRVLEAADGAAAIRAASDLAPAIALVDLNLPVTDGFQVVRALKARYGPALPVIVLSGMTEPDTRLHAFDVGADDFVPKPIHVPELLKRIDAFERTRRAYLELQAAKERAEHLRLWAAEASALLAHDLNNGLCVALSNLSFVQEASAGALPPDEVDALASSVRAIQRMAGLVKNFVDISRLEDAALIAERSRTDLCELLAGAISIHEAEANKRGARVTFHCTPGLAASVDPSLIERVIHNLVGNAVRYVDAGDEIRVRARVEPDIGPRCLQTLIVEVGNTGSGIPESLRPHLFQKYRTGNDGRSSTGMGLYFSRLACEAHGGRIDLEPQPPFEARFVIRIPAE